MIRMHFKYIVKNKVKQCSLNMKKGGKLQLLDTLTQDSLAGKG